jgi:HEAT repeat protein
MGPQAAAAVPVLLAQLARDDTQDYMRKTFIETVGKIGDHDAVPILLAELNAAPLTTPDLNRAGQSPIYEILSALVRLGASDEAVLAAIRRRLASDDPIAPVSALRALEQLSSDPAEITARYLECLCNQRGLQVRVEIILTIGRLTGDRKDAVPLLIALLTDRSPEIRKAAAWTLGALGAEASTALPDLRSQLQDWKDSQYPIHRWQPTNQPENPRTHLDRGRWLDADNPLKFPDSTTLTGPEYPYKSIQQIVTEAITKIEAANKPP